MMKKILFGYLIYYMFDYDFEQEDKDLKKVGLELMFLTPEKCSCDEGISAVELSKLLGMNLDIVKRKLKILYDHNIVRVIGINPKLWKFDEYSFQRMEDRKSVV